MYALLILGLIISLAASWNVNATFRRYEKDSNSRGLTAAQVARQILDENGLYQIRVERISGKLTDHYDPSGNVIRLSDSVHDSTSVAAIGVAAHECGHAVQHEVGYFPMKIRSAVIPVTQIGSKFWYIIFLIGLVFGNSQAGQIMQMIGMSQVSQLFSRKGFNVESLAVGATDNPAISRMTIEVLANQNQTNLMCNQLAKMVPVHSVKLLNPNHSIRRELILYKVRAKNSDDKNEIIQIANIFRGSIIDVSKETLTLSVIGDEKKTDAVQELLAEFGIVELVRTGMIALERGKYTIDEDTKEKGEFNYGKDVL